MASTCIKSWWQHSKARRAWHKVLRGWEFLQVELHGKYSVERMYNLKDSAAHTDPVSRRGHGARLHAAAGPEQGPSVQPRLLATRVLHDGDHFPDDPRAATQTAWVFAVALVVGFPVPFTVAVGVSVGCPLLALCFVVGWSKSLKANPVVKGELINFAAIVGIQVGLTYVYPVYNYVFVSLAPSSQTAFALLLPMLKLAMKNWLSYIVRHMEGFNPKMVVSNVEIFHALYVACCMQCSNSNNTKILLIAMDFLQAIASIYDVDSDLRPITRIEKRIEKSRTAVRQSSRQAMEPPAASSGFHKKAQTGKDEDDGDDDMYAGKDDAAAPSSIPLLDMAQYMIEKDDQVRCHSSIRFESSHHRPSHAAQIAPQQPHARIAGKQTISVAHKSVQKLPVSAGADDSHLQTNSGPADAPPSGPPSWLTPVKRSHGSMLSEKDKKSVSALSSADRLEYVQEMLQLLHLTEFVLLVEFTEVVIPIVYSFAFLYVGLYLLVMGTLPNRVYYAQLKNLEFHTLLHTVGNIMVYALLEVLSFVLLSLILSKKLKISSIHQLAFVLEHHWAMAQSKLILWVVFTVQSSLEHFGADYSFQFQWLHAGNN